MLSFALLGAGRIGIMHAQNIAEHPHATLAAVYDPSDTAARTAAESFGGVASDNADDAIHAADAVLIASATQTHCDYIEQAVAADKPVLCEKPIHLDNARVKICRDKLAQYPHSLVQIGFNRRFDPGHAGLQARVAGGDIGKVEKLIITSRDPALPSADYLAAAGGLFRDMMIHDFDLARFILTEEPARLVAAAATLITPTPLPDEADTAMVIMQTAGGAMCHINCSRRAVYGYDQRVEVLGDKGMLISGNRTATAVTHYNAQHTDAGEPLLHFFIDRYADSYRRQLDAFITAVDHRVVPSPSLADGQRALILAEAAEQSYRLGQWTIMADFEQKFE